MMNRDADYAETTDFRRFFSCQSASISYCPAKKEILSQRRKGAEKFNKTIRVHPCSSVAIFSNTKTPTLADRRSGFDTGLAATGKGLGLRKRLNAGGTQPLGAGRAALSHFHLLNVDIPFVAGGFLRPGPVVAKLGTFAALLTLCHNSFAPLLSCVRSFPPLSTLLNLLFVEKSNGKPSLASDTITV
jgi:hypothetical protein